MSGLGEDGRSREALLAELERRSRDLELAQSIARIGSWDYTAADEVLRWSDELFRLLGEGVMTLPVDGVYGFDDVRNAVVASTRPGRVGKVLLRP